MPASEPKWYAQHAPVHAEENLIKELQRKVSEVT